MGPRPALSPSSKSLWLLSAGELKGTQLRLCVLQPQLSEKTGSGFKPSVKSISLKRKSRSCSGESAQPREPSITHGPLTRSSLQPCILREPANRAFLLPLLFLLRGGWLWRKGKSLRGTVLTRFYTLLLLSAPLFCLPQEPARPSAAGERCRSGRAARLPRGLRLQLGSGDRLAKGGKLPADPGAHSNEGQLQRGSCGAGDCCLPGK